MPERLPRVLLITTGHAWPHCYFDYYVEQALADLTCEYRVFDVQAEALARATPGGLDALEGETAAAGLERLSTAFAPDVVLCMMGYEAHRLAGLRREGAVLVTWQYEDPQNVDLFLESSRYADLVVTPEPNCIPLYQEAGAQRVEVAPMACYHRLYRPLPPFAGHESDVCLLGYPFQNRVTQLRDLVSRTPGTRWAVVGPGWGQAGLTPPPIHLVSTAVHPVEAVKYRSSTSINLYIHRDVLMTNPENSNRRNIAANSLVQVYELAGCRRLVLTDRRASVDQHFPDGGLGIYTDTDSCLRLLEHFLRNADEREAYAEVAHRQVLRAHTYVHRVQQILTAAGFPTGRRPDTGRPAPLQISAARRIAWQGQPTALATLHHLDLELADQYPPDPQLPDPSVAGGQGS